MAQFGQSARLGAVRSQVRILLPRLFILERNLRIRRELAASFVFIFIPVYGRKRQWKRLILASIR